MRGILPKLKKRIVVLFGIAVIVALTLCTVITGFGMAASAEESGPLTKAEESVDVKAYRLADNTGYHEDEAAVVSKESHPLLNNLINLSVYTQSDVAESKVDRGRVSGYEGYGITGSSASIRLSYNFDDPEKMVGENGYKYSISSDTAESVGSFERIGVIGTGAILFQKKDSPDADWEWQTKDGETKKQLHTFNFTDLVRLNDYASGETYTLYTPSGEDLAKGVFIKITFAYELKYEFQWREQNWLGIWKTKTETRYVNMLETAEFYLVQNSGRVLFHNASNFDQVGEEGGSGAITIDKFETILSGDVTLNGFRLDTLGVDAYDITYQLNGGDVQKAYDGQFFLAQGRYDFSIRRKIGPNIPYTIFVDRREVNAAVLGYFGKSLFTPDSQRVYTTGEYPAYLAGSATWNLNATDGTVAPIVGKLFKMKGEGEEEFVYDIAQPFGADYKTQALQGTIHEAGVYKAEFWGNPRYLTESEISGDLYHFTFRFEIVDRESQKQPSVNEAYLNGMAGFSDLQSKYYSVALPTAGTGKAIFAFADYGGAYDFAYKLEREKVTQENGAYRYNGKTYTVQSDVLAEIDKAANKLVTVRYFDPTNPETYQTADVADENILSLNFTKDVIVFTGDSEQEYMRAGLPSLNGRKFRYITPDSDVPEEGSLDFAFIHLAGFESDQVTLTHQGTGTVYDILFDVPVEYQLQLKNAPSGVYTVHETNSFGDTSEYEAVYIAPGDMTGSATVSLYRNGAFTERTFCQGNTATETNVNGFILKSVSNELDPYSIVKVTKDGQTRLYTFPEVEDIWFHEGGVYDFVLSDRLGNTVAFSIVITAPVGYADIYLQLEQADETIETHFRAFVGQEIALPVPALSSELFVFDGWLYNDTLITDNKFTPDVSGTQYIWQQLTQKYTYLNFNANGGAPVERLKAAIGEPVELPVATSPGWSFGGWEYAGNVYTGSYTPTSVSPTFQAVWNYEYTTIELYDGNNRETITANAGDKVALPFPTRAGYTFFGWREELGEGAIKVYYGQITKLANVQTLRLDALWIREGSVDSDSLSGGTGGRTMLHFVDGTLLAGDSLQTLAGATVALPKPTRAGYAFVGWIWRTTPISGKIFTGDTMAVPDGADNKIMLEAVWIAKSTGGAQGIAAGTTAGGAWESFKGFIEGNGATLAAALLGVCLLGYCCALLSRKRRRFLGRFTPCNTVSIRARKHACAQPVLLPQTAFMEAAHQAATAAYGNPGFYKSAKRSRAVACAKYGLLTVFTAMILTAVLSFTYAFGDWVRLGSFQVIAQEIEAAQTIAQIEEGEDAGLNNGYTGGTFDVAPQPTKDEVVEKFGELTDFNAEDITDALDLTEEEKFLYSLILFDLSSFGYYVFTAQAVLPNNEKVLGLGYSTYKEAYSLSDNLLYYSAGFIALPRQTPITDEDIKNDVKIYDNSVTEAGIKEQEKYAFLLSFTESYGPYHFVLNEQYVVYSIENTSLNYTSVSKSDAVFNAQYGAVYSYDDEIVVYDPDFGKTNEVNATSLNTLLDPAIAKNEYSRYIAEQTANGFTVDTMNFVYISYEALDAYYLSEQDESLLGIDVQEFYDMERSVGPNEYYTVDADGNLTKLEFPPQEESKASWLDRLAGAILAIGMVCVGVIIVAAVSVVSCGAATAAAPYIMGAFIGGGVEVFMQTVIQGKKVEDINWLRVGIAAVSGAASAIPGIGWFGAGLLQGVTEAALTAADGGSLQDVLSAFTVGFVSGVVIHGVGKALSKVKFCFVAGTGVLMASGGVKAIENIRVGDMLKSCNSVTGKTENKRVLQTFENKTSELVTVVTSDGQQVTATPGHKFYANGNWVSAKSLKAGDILINVNGQKVIVEKTQHEILETPVKVYNFEVADNHNYFVAENINAPAATFVLVHNKRCGTTVGGSNIDDLTTGYKKVIEGIEDAPDVLQANSVYLKKAPNGQITNIAFYNNQEKIIRRIDIKGVPHFCEDIGEKYIPHMHKFEYNLGKDGVYYKKELKKAFSVADDIVEELLKFFGKGK